MLIVLTDSSDLPEAPEDPLEARAYLDPAGALTGARSGSRLVNLCRSWEYPSEGYYVSLLADARGHRPIPTVDVMRSLKSADTVLRGLQAAGVPTDPEGLGAGEVVEFLVCLGRTAEPRFRRLAAQIFRVWSAPLLRVEAVGLDESLKVRRVRPVGIDQVEPLEREFLKEAVHHYAEKGRSPRPQEAPRAQIAVLHEARLNQNASTAETIERFVKVGRKMGVHLQSIGLDELERVSDFDALFLRVLTGVDLPSFAFAQRAEALGMPVIDDTRSIIRCSNKVFVQELLAREGIRTPKTVTAARQTPFAQLVKGVGLPFVLKLPDGSFSNAVFRIEDEDQYRLRSEALFEAAPLLLVQAYSPTAFDWRVTLLGGEPLFVSKYYMAKGDWRIATTTPRGMRYGRVEAVPRRQWPPELVRIAARAAGLIGDGLYGVDVKELEKGVFAVIEVNDNPNIDVGYDDAASGDDIYEAVIQYFLKRIAAGHQTQKPRRIMRPDPSDLQALRAPIGRARPIRDDYRAYEVCGLELEYAVVDRDLNVRSLVAPALALLAGNPTSDVSLGVVGLSNEITDHVLELKTEVPLRSLAQTEEYLVEGVRRVSALLSARFGARLLPTGMHPWFDPKQAQIWQRSNRRIYETYTRLFDVYTHGWSNVHALHVNLPMGEESDAVGMMNAAVQLLPYLPALCASSPMHDGELQPAVDNRLAWILEHQVRLPESCGKILPGYVTSTAAYKKDVLGDMYKAVDRLPDAAALRREFLNARGAVFKFSRTSLEVRVIDVQECVKMDCAVAAFVRAALKTFAVDGKRALPDWDLLLEDFFATVKHGSRALVHAPHVPVDVPRDASGKVPVRAVLRALLDRSEKRMHADEEPYVELLRKVIANGSLSEAIQRVLAPHVEDPDRFTEAARRVYVELSECLVENEPWRGRWSS